MTLFIYIGLVIILVGTLLFLYITLQKRKLGSLGEKMLYSDSDLNHADVLLASSLPLKGKPDAIIRTKEGIIPLEIKTGRTPRMPRENHTMQLMAYCLLVHEYYKERPTGGILRYSETGTEFKIKYTQEAEASVRTIVKEIIKAKVDKQSFSCNHPDHNK